MTAMISGATVPRTAVTRTDQTTGTRFTKSPVERLIRAPAMSEGRILNDAPSAEVLWTSWKLCR